MDQGGGAEIMYLDLYKGLNLKPKNLTGYDSPLLGFDGFYCGGCLFSLHNHCSTTLASCPEGYFFHPPLESEISIQGLN